MSGSDQKGADATLAATPAGAPGAARSQTAEPATSAVIAGRYEIIGLLGAGGMGSVYRARDRELDETVAIKMLRRELVDRPDSLERFRREVKLARKVTHRNVARTFDIGEHDGEKYLTMELVEGESLAARLVRDGALTVSVAVALAQEILAGLEAAHAAGVIHRDLKPDNVLIARDGRVVLTDFGIARADDSARVGAAQTAGIPLGTPLYMSPEQVEGSRTIDARADVYAFGAMLYEMLVGQPPFDGETVVAIMLARLTRPPPDPRVVRPDLPTALADVVMKCMAKRPEDRPGGAAEISRVLATMTMPLPSVEAKPTRPSRPPAPLPERTTGGRLRSLAVLPFRNSGPPDDEYLAEGATEDLIDTLSMTPLLRVRSRGAVMKFKGRDMDPREIGRELDVQVVVDGSLRRTPGSVRVTARLQSVADGFQIWAKRFDRAESELLAVADEIAREVSAALTVHLDVPDRAVHSDPEAVDLYLRARAEHRKLFAFGAGRAVPLYEAALARAPDEPTFLAGYASALVRVWFAGTDPTGTALDRARVAAQKAVASAPHLGDAHVALATIALHTDNAVESMHELKRALRAAPGLAPAHEMLGLLLLEIGRIPEAVKRLEAAIALDSAAINAYADLARAHALLGDFTTAHATLARLESLNAAEAAGALGRMYARFATWQGDFERAADLLARAVAPSDPAATMGVRQMVSKETPVEVRRQIMDMVFNNPSNAPRRRVLFGQIETEIAASVGDLSWAIDVLQRAVRDGLIDLSWLDACPVLATLRPDPAFAAARATVAERAQRIVEAYLAE